MKKNLPFIPLFPLDYKKISEAKLLPQSKTLFDLSAPGQGLIINVDLENNRIIMVPAYNKGDAEGKELDKHGKPLPQFIRSFTSRVRGIPNPASTGGNLHVQVDQLYGLGGKPRIGMGAWKNDKDGIEELAHVSTLQMFSIRWRRTFKEYFKLRTLGHASHSMTLLREAPYEICKYIVDALYKELNLPLIPIENNPAISVMARYHFHIQKEWENYTHHCLKELFTDLMYAGEEKLIAEIIKEHQQEEEKFEDKTDLYPIMEEVKQVVSLLKAAKMGDILEFRAALSNMEHEGIPLSQAYIIEKHENVLTLAAATGHIGIINDILDYLKKVHPNQRLILEAKTDAKKTPLVTAIENGHNEAALLLLPYCNTLLNIFNALMAAIKTANLEIIKAILLKPQNITATLMFCKDENGRNPLMMAAMTGRLEVVKLIFKGNPDPRILTEIDSEGNNILMMSIKNKHDHIIEFLYQAGVDFKSTFLLNLQKRDFDILKKIIHYYFTCSKTEAYPFLYLLLAESIKQDDKVFFNVLLSCIPQEYLTQTHSILNLAAHHDKPQFIEDYLKIFKFIPDEKSIIPATSSGISPLSSAWLAGNKACIKFLLDRGIITLDDFNYAVCYEDFQLLELILPGIPPTLPYIDITLSCDCVEAAEPLIQKLPSVDHHLDEKGNSMLILAIKHGAFYVTKHLIESHKADPHQPDAKGSTPLTIAAGLKNIGIFELVLKSADHPKAELMQILEYAGAEKNSKMLEIITQHLKELPQSQAGVTQNPQAFVNTQTVRTRVQDSQSTYTFSL